MLLSKACKEVKLSFIFYPQYMASTPLAPGPGGCPTVHGSPVWTPVNSHHTHTPASCLPGDLYGGVS